eukprot:717023-Prymnesium_polylepis.3
MRTGSSYLRGRSRRHQARMVGSPRRLGWAAPRGSARVRARAPGWPAALHAEQLCDERSLARLARAQLGGHARGVGRARLKRQQWHQLRKRRARGQALPLALGAQAADERGQHKRSIGQDTHLQPVHHLSQREHGPQLCAGALREAQEGQQLDDHSLDGRPAERVAAAGDGERCELTFAAECLHASSMLAGGQLGRRVGGERAEEVRHQRQHRGRGLCVQLGQQLH